MTEDAGNKGEHGQRNSFIEKFVKKGHTVRVHNKAVHHRSAAPSAKQCDISRDREVKYVYRGYCKDILFHNFPEVREAMDIFMESDGADIFVEVQTQSAKIYLTNSAGDEVKMTMTGRVFVIE